MFRFLTDQNFNNDVLRAVIARESTLDIVRTQDSGLASANDEDLLNWAARENRIVLTHDEKTMIGIAYERVKLGQAMPGVILVRQNLPVAKAIDLLLMAIGASLDDDFVDQVRHIPF